MTKTSRREPVRHTAATVVNTGQVTLYAVCAVLLIVGLVTVPLIVAQVTVAVVLSFFAVFVGLMKMGLWHASTRHTHLDYDVPDADDPTLPHYLVLVPMFREPDMIAPMMSGMAGLEYPKDRLRVKLLVESRERDPSTRAAIDTVDVPDDRPMLVVVGADTGRPIVHLHGMCSEARSDLEAWGPSVSRFGTILALQGNTPCSGGGDNATWTTDVADIDRRISAAIDAVRARGVKLDDREVILIGESMGASRAEALAARFPDKYTRLVLIGAPQTPSPKNLDHAAAVALLAGEREGQQKMLDGTTALSAHGLPARFWELPGAVHGAYGHDGDRVMGEAVGFVVTRGAR